MATGMSDWESPNYTNPKPQNPKPKTAAWELESGIWDLLPDRLPVGRNDFDRDIELAQLRFNLRAVADSHNHHPLRDEISLRRGQRLIGGHRAYPFGDVAVVIETKVVDEDLREAGGSSLAGLKACRQ